MTEDWGDAEWEGYARQAKAREIAGAPLNKYDREALRRFPNPPMLGPHGYGPPRVCP